MEAISVKKFNWTTVAEIAVGIAIGTVVVAPLVVVINNTVKGMFKNAQTTATATT